MEDTYYSTTVSTTTTTTTTTTTVRLLRHLTDVTLGVTLHKNIKLTIRLRYVSNGS